MLGLSGNALKLVAAALMVVDHAGMLFFPDVILFRIIGRLAMPIFAFFIGEGCRYTRSRKRYFFTVFSLGAGCQLVYFLAMGDTYMNILITFSLGILVIYALQDLRAALSGQDTRPMVRSALVLILTLLLVWFLNRKLEIDYGFWGCILPAWAAALHPREKGRPGIGNNPRLHVLSMIPGLVLLWQSLGGIQGYSLYAVPLLLCYNGKRGNPRFKYWFYLFYPGHLALLQGLAWLLQ